MILRIEAMKYFFALQNDGAQIEALGGMSLLDDREAICFGGLIARDLAEGPDRGTGLTIAITNGTRAVRKITVE
jgi:hypothetical protein